MALLQEIQLSLLDENTNIRPILLKLRYLSDRLGSGVLEEWVRYEIEGYPNSIEVPDYRNAVFTFSGTFSNGYRQLNNISIPPYLVGLHAGKEWESYSIRDPLPVVEQMMAEIPENKNIGVDASNLKLVLQDKIYEGYTILDFSANFDLSAFVTITNAVRAKLLDFSLELEKNVPISTQISVGEIVNVSSEETTTVTNITNNIFNAQVSNIASIGDGSILNASVVQSEISDLKAALETAGLSVEEANELAGIAESENPMSPGKPFGDKAKKWIGERLTKGVDGLLRIGGKVLEDDIAKIFQDYYDKF